MIAGARCQMSYCINCALICNMIWRGGGAGAVEGGEGKIRRCQSCKIYMGPQLLGLSSRRKRWGGN